MTSWHTGRIEACKRANYNMNLVIGNAIIELKVTYIKEKIKGKEMSLIYKV